MLCKNCGHREGEHHATNDGEATDRWCDGSRECTCEYFEEQMDNHKLIQGGCECGCPHVPGLDKKATDAFLQIDEWRKCGAALRDEMLERLAQEGLEMSDTPKSHYSPACNRLLELLREAK